ncbi:hypothetical protein L9F63_011097 [Diploptera punctata]|uniref:GH16 domain-containing protein n=1 Tax=Diploptera punctata TaxID=6984 RepID=A0AAD8EQD6_DIPPU|nr:hypothetical protein L9F63_011097 [Diploptera punctata]
MWNPLVAILVVTLVGTVTGESLVWSDEFDTLDESKWNHLVTAWGGGNQEFEYYRNSRTNSYVKDGVLYIKPTWTSSEYGDDFLYSGSLTISGCNMEPCTSSAGADIVKPILSARMTSSYSFKYGRAEIRAKLPHGDWIWPAIWMLPKSSVYGDWPRSGEIDIMESRGNVGNLYDGNGVNQGSVLYGSTLHWGVDANHNNYWRTHWEKFMLTGSDLGDDYHLYGLDWGDNYISFTYDGVEIGRQWAPQDGFWYFANFENDPGGTNIWQSGSWMAPFDQEFQFILNVAVGGTYFGDGVGNRPWSWDGHPQKDFWERRSEWISTWNEEDAALKIDYIRVYQ